MLYRVKNIFKDAEHNGEVREENQVLALTEDRANDLIGKDWIEPLAIINLTGKEIEAKFVEEEKVEKVDVVDEFDIEKATVEQMKEKLTELQVDFDKNAKKGDLQTLLLEALNKPEDE